MLRGEGACRVGARQGPGAAFGLHLRHAEGLHPKAAIGEGGIGRHQIKQSHLPSAKRNRAIAREGAIQPGTPRGFRHFAMPARALQQPHGGGIHAMRQGLLHGDFAARTPWAIAWRPAAKIERRIGDHVLRPHAGFQSRQEKEGLEGAAGLAPCLRRAVEGAIAVILAPRHGAHRTGCGIQRHHGALMHPGPRAWPGQDRVNPRLGRRLQGGVECGAQHQISAGRRASCHAILHPIGEPAGIARRCLGEANSINRLQSLGRCQRAGFRHRGQHFQGTRHRGSLIDARIDARWRLGQPRQYRRLPCCQPPGWDTKIKPRSRIHAISAGAEIDAVQINLQQFILAEALFQPEGQHGFLRLALQAAFRRQEQVFRQLLREG